MKILGSEVTVHYACEYPDIPADTTSQIQHPRPTDQTPHHKPNNLSDSSDDSMRFRASAALGQIRRRRAAEMEKAWQREAS